jgi:hypothetical protein
MRNEMPPSAGAGAAASAGLEACRRCDGRHGRCACRGPKRPVDLGDARIHDLEQFRRWREVPQRLPVLACLRQILLLICGEPAVPAGLRVGRLHRDGALEHVARLAEELRLVHQDTRLGDTQHGIHVPAIGELQGLAVGVGRLRVVPHHHVGAAQQLPALGVAGLGLEPLFQLTGHALERRRAVAVRRSRLRHRVVPGPLAQGEVEAKSGQRDPHRDRGRQRPRGLGVSVLLRNSS